MYPLLQAQVTVLLRNLLETPQKFEAHLDRRISCTYPPMPKPDCFIYRMLASTIVKSTYNYDIQSNEDAYNKLASEAASAVVSLGLNGLTLVDIFPSRKQEKHAIDCCAHLPSLVRYVPTWFPGMSLLKRAKKARILIDRMVDEPYQYVKSQRVSSTVRSGPLFTSIYTGIRI